MHRRFAPVAVLTAVFAVFSAGTSHAVVEFDQDVTNEIIFGAGNANGGFTTDRANGVELGLRAKLRHNAAGTPENTFNSNGDGTYTFQAGVAPTQVFPTGVWSFEWSINSDYDGTTGADLADYTYQLSMTSTTAASIAPFDPINDNNPGLVPLRVQWDHGIGDNTTGNGGGSVIPNVNNDAPGYAAMIASNSLAQNSWKPHWFAPAFDPTLTGDYAFSLTAFDPAGGVLARTSILVGVVPEPTSLGLLSLAGLCGLLSIRRRVA